MTDLDNYAPGDKCPEKDCGGMLDIAPPIGCSCHISAPCGACVHAGVACDDCGWRSSPENYDDEYEPIVTIKRRLEDRSAHTTRTHVDNPFNSTPFTDCCGVAAVNEPRCPSCNAEITGHADGLAARRAAVGPGNCLMCGNPKGPIEVSGNCHC